MKKLLAALALSASLFTSFALANFNDIPANHSNKVAIDALVEQGVLKGYENGNFEPTWAVTRAEAVKIILLGMDVELSEDSIAAAIFRDLDEDAWFYSIIGTAVSEGIVKGYDDLTFRPNQTVTRAEAAKMVMLASGYPTDVLGPMTFLDVNSNDWFFEYSNFMSTFNIEPAQTDGLWHPEQNMTRSDLSEMVYRMQHYIETGAAFDESTNWIRYGFPEAKVSMKVPFGWSIQQDGLGAIWLSDTANGQASLLNPKENGATLFVSVNENLDGLDADQWLDNIDAGIEYSTTRGELGSSAYPALFVYVNSGDVFREWYVYLEDGHLLHLQALRGTGKYQVYLEDYLDAIVRSLEYEANATSLNLEESIAAIRSAIQIDGVGEKMMDLLSDLELIETDSIGIGTGPVDYFYSPSADITIKYERSFDIILGVQTGRSSAF